MPLKMESQLEDARERLPQRSSVSAFTVGELRKYVLEERKSHVEERRRLNQLLDREAEARRRSEEARRRAEEALRARCCTVM